MPSIRVYRPADEAAVIALWERCDLVVPWNVPAEDIAAKVAFQPDLFFVAEREGERAGVERPILGTVMAGYEGHRGWINYLAVHPAERRSGLGRALMSHAEAELARRGCPKVNLQVRAGNAAVVEFYERLGYSRDDVIGLGKRLDGR